MAEPAAPLPVRLIAVDIDGTLLDPQFQLPPANAAALRRAHERGLDVALVTGRRHGSALPIALELGFPVCLISSDGAVTRTSDGALFHRHLLPRAAARELLHRLRACRAHTALIFDRDGPGTVVVEARALLTARLARWMEKNAPVLADVAPLEDALAEDPVQIMLAGTIAEMRAPRVVLADADLAGLVTVLRTEYEARDLCILDLLAEGCSKGHGVARFAASRGVPLGAVMAIGDNFNDLEMLELCGHPVVMGNACAELRGAGFAVTLPNDQAGVAAAVERALTSPTPSRG
ncbi:MAG TPA: HAD family hydrolase [Polyangia bacterium]